MPFDNTPHTDTRSVVDVLRDAKAVISSPDMWCKGAIYDRRPLSNGGTTLTYCAVGAIMSVSNASELSPNSLVMSALSNKAIGYLASAARYSADGYIYTSPGMVVQKINDSITTTHTDMMRLFDKAITIAEADTRNGVVSHAT